MLVFRVSMYGRVIYLKSFCTLSPLTNYLFFTVTLGCSV